MNHAPNEPLSDRDSLKAFSRARRAALLAPVVARYLSFVHSSAFRRTGDATRAAEVSRAVFLVLARRAGRMRSRTVLPEWLFAVTEVASRKLANEPRRWLQRFQRKKQTWPPGTTLAVALPRGLEPALDRMSRGARNAILLRIIHGEDWPAIASALRTSEHRSRKRTGRAFRQLSKYFQKRGVNANHDEIAAALADLNVPIPDGLQALVLGAIEESRGAKPASRLARETLVTLAWRRWRRRVAVGIPCFLALLIAVGSLAWYIDSLSGHSRSITAFIVWSVRNESRKVPGLAQPARPWPTDLTTAADARRISTAQDLYNTTSIWPAHLKFSREQWQALEPRQIGPLPHFLQPDGTVLLRHPEATRSGLAGVLGWDFDWTHADFEFGGVAYTNVAARFKGNGTYLSSLHGNKRPFKVDLNDFVKGRKLASRDEMNFHNMTDDRSCLSDTLAYEFLREARVPAPRTAYAYLSVTVEGKWDRQPLGLYVMVEPVDEEFARDRFGSRKTALFKPVTYELFRYLGDDWAAYEKIYDSRRQTTVKQQRRLIELSRLVSEAGDEEFAGRVGEFVDLDAFARFLAGEVLLSAYDSFLSNGQNFYLYLDPRTDRFGFIPWDMDLAWGGFFLLGSTRQREQASIWHPWVGKHRFLERMMGVEEFREIYRARLEEFLETLFTPSRLYPRIDQMAGVIREAVAAESDFRLAKFDQAVGRKPVVRVEGTNPQGADRPAHQLKPFIEKRIRSVRAQLDGKSEGVILRRGERR